MICYLKTAASQHLFTKRITVFTCPANTQLHPLSWVCALGARGPRWETRSQTPQPPAARPLIRFNSQPQTDRQVLPAHFRDEKTRGSCASNGSPRGWVQSCSAAQSPAAEVDSLLPSGWRAPRCGRRLATYRVTLLCPSAGDTEEVASLFSTLWAMSPLPCLFFFLYPWPREQNPVQLRISVSTQCKAPLPGDGTLDVPSVACRPDAGSHEVSVGAGPPRAQLPGLLDLALFSLVPPAVGPWQQVVPWLLAACWCPFSSNGPSPSPSL